MKICDLQYLVSISFVGVFLCDAERNDSYDVISNNNCKSDRGTPTICTVTLLQRTVTILRSRQSARLPLYI